MAGVERWHWKSKFKTRWSNGVKKKIHYARALAQNSKIFIIDDPFGYLDNQGIQIVQKII